MPSAASTSSILKVALLLCCNNTMGFGLLIGVKLYNYIYQKFSQNVPSCFPYFFKNTKYNRNVYLDFFNEGFGMVVFFIKKNNIKVPIVFDFSKNLLWSEMGHFRCFEVYRVIRG